MKVKVTVPKAGLRARKLGRINGVADGEYEVNLVATLTDSEGESVAATHTFKQLRMNRPINHAGAFTLVKHDSVDGELILTVTATISAAGYAKPLKTFAKGAKGLSTILDGVAKAVGGTPIEGILKTAGIAIELSDKIFNALAELVENLEPIVTIVERRVLHPQPGADLHVTLGSPTKTTSEPPSPYFFLEYDVTA